MWISDNMTMLEHKYDGIVTIIYAEMSVANFLVSIWFAVLNVQWVE